MAYCKQCGANIPEYAKFCPKCGMANPVEAVQPASDEPTVKPVVPQSEATPPVQQPVPAPQYSDNSVPPQQQPVIQQQASQQPPKPLDFTWFNSHFMLLFVIVGVAAYALSQLAAVYISISTGFGIVLGVFAILLAAATLAVAIVRYVAAMRETAELRKKYAMRDNICLAVGIIVFVFVLLTSIALFVMGDMLSSFL